MVSEKQEKKWLRFEETVSSTKKTKVFMVYNDVTQNFLGWVRWCNGWRAYRFESIDYSIGIGESCHREFADFIHKLMKERGVTKNGR